MNQFYNNYVKYYISNSQCQNFIKLKINLTSLLLRKSTDTVFDQSFVN